MQEFITLLLIGIGLSMDTFSLSLSIGTLNITEKQTYLISIIVGIMHFLMPLIGITIGNKFLQIFEFNSHYLLSIVLFILAFKLIVDLFQNEELNINLNFLGILLFSFLVSIDSLSTGFALSTITSNIFLATTIFSICSCSFTYIGLIIGKYTTEKLGRYANIIGIVLLLLVAIKHLCQ